MSGPTGVASKRRVRARVVVDVRLTACVQALAIDPRDQLCAWSRRPLPAGCDMVERVRQVRQAVEYLAVAVGEIRVLWGPHEIELAIDTDDTPLDRNLAVAFIRRDAMVAPDESVACAFRATPAGRFIFGGSEAPLMAVAEAFDDVLPAGPLHSVDLLLLWDLCAEGGALVDCSDGLLTLVARESQRPLLRRIPLNDSSEATLAAGLAGLLERGLPMRCSGLPVPLPGGSRQALPRLGKQLLPASFELAWQLGKAGSFPRLEGPHIDQRARIHRATRAMAYIGVLMLLLGSMLGYYGYRARAKALAARESVVQISAPLFERLEIMRHSEQLDLANKERAERLRLNFPQTPLGELLYELAESLPEGVGWSQLTIIEGRLELVLVATDRGELEAYREALQRRPELADVGWQPIAYSARSGMWLQTVHGILLAGI